MKGRGYVLGRTALVAAIATIATPSLSQDTAPVSTTVLEGSALAAQGSRGPAGLGSAVLDRAASCGLDADALRVVQSRFSAEPTDAAEEAALDARVEEISAKAGMTGPRGDRQASRAMIRAMLTERLLLTLEYRGVKGEAGMACLVDGLAEAGFSRVEKAPAE